LKFLSCPRAVQPEHLSESAFGCGARWYARVVLSCHHQCSIMQRAPCNAMCFSFSARIINNTNTRAAIDKSNIPDDARAYIHHVMCSSPQRISNISTIRLRGSPTKKALTLSCGFLILLFHLGVRVCIGPTEHDSQICVWKLSTGNLCITPRDTFNLVQIYSLTSCLCMI
jgi:hypothetical protein